MLAVAVLWIGIGASVLRTGFDLLGPLPLSRLAEDERAVDLFGPTLVAAGLLFLAFAVHLWSSYPTGRGFLLLMTLGMIGQVVAGMVPIGAVGHSDPVHVVAALALGASIPLFLWRFAAAQAPGPWRRWTWALLWLQVAASAIGIALSRRGVAPLAEIVPAATFHLWVLTVAFGPRAERDAVRELVEAPLVSAARPMATANAS